MTKRALFRLKDQFRRVHIALRKSPLAQQIPWPQVLVGVALISTVAGSIAATRILATQEKKLAEAKEMARPANVSILKIPVTDCADCFSVDDAVATFKKQNVQVSDEQTLTPGSQEATSLIKSLGITKLPTYVVKGEIRKKSLESFVIANGSIKNDAFVFTGVTPLYIDPETGKTVGNVSVTYLTDPGCPKCVNPKTTVDAYKKAGIRITSEREVVWSSPEGQKIIESYSLTKLPTFLLSAEVAAYPAVKENWANIGSIESDGTYAARSLIAPYRDIARGRVVGYVDVVFLTDSSCPQCYKAEKVHRDILVNGYAVAFKSEQLVDVNSASGRALVSKYAIKQVPTFLISADISEYPNVMQIWPQVGSIEPDGWYVFRSLSQLGNKIYKDLEKNEVIGQASPSASPAKKE